ncbi:GNAT family N-acetyltransferase [Nonomuraea sp. NN258]|uniref:GNAT family N-acetyltransferase n=1 Tax=Nonomuraea antri TaxID=2730852 RepID=UPI001567D8B2|nr:GNAT family N-acetyltransferase [Nonomuraea antri]NRQ39536.1 GNAT family N-acetyltransferase [Nonomuraea antri]
MSDELSRIHAFLRDFARRRTPRLEPAPGGFAVLDERYPGSHDDNKLIVWTGDDPHAVIAAADELLAGRGHRLVLVHDDRLGTAFAPAFTAAGYEHGVNVLMAHRGPREPAAAAAEHLDLATLLPVVRAGWRASLPDADDEVITQLTDRVETRLRGADTVAFRGVRDADGALAATADLYLHDGVAQIESVVTVEAYRGRGHARTLLTSMLAETAAAGAGLVFLEADAADWPKDFYARLGFEPVGRIHTFLRW